jgi:hypothetical protein
MEALAASDDVLNIPIPITKPNDDHRKIKQAKLILLCHRMKIQKTLCLVTCCLVKRKYGAYHLTPC